jgi:hypothetical protein
VEDRLIQSESQSTSVFFLLAERFPDAHVQLEVKSVDITISIVYERKIYRILLESKTSGSLPTKDAQELSAAFDDVVAHLEQWKAAVHFDPAEDVLYMVAGVCCEPISF